MKYFRHSRVGQLLATCFDFMILLTTMTLQVSCRGSLGDAVFEGSSPSYISACWMS